ncbi:MAG: hypothetical protein SPL12_07690 [Bacteroidales bacterium]|nr:hypothetical protein [Bacteroidales bacterium]
MEKTFKFMALLAMGAALAFAACGTGGGTGTETAEWVDLGLPSGLLWAACNLGASSPEEYGDYYAWGETTTKEVYNWSTYKYCTASTSIRTSRAWTASAAATAVHLCALSAPRAENLTLAPSRATGNGERRRAPACESSACLPKIYTRMNSSIFEGVILCAFFHSIPQI